MLICCVNLELGSLYFQNCGIGVFLDLIWLKFFPFGIGVFVDLPFFYETLNIPSCDSSAIVAVF